jgi:two-component system, response regulator PdtaR
MDAECVPNGENRRRRLVVLVVEDEVLVRAAAAEQLRGIGYAVIEAADASQALQVLQSRIRVDLVFTDVTMPGLLDGADLARVVLIEYPPTKVVLTSGKRRDEADLERLPILYKPYAFAELERLIAELIGKPDNVQ